MINRKFVIVFFVGIILLISTHTSYVSYLIQPKLDTTELYSGSCYDVYIGSKGYLCPKESLILGNETQLQDLFSSLYDQRDTELKEVDFDDKLVIFVYISLLNDGWIYDLIGLTEDGTTIQVHILEQRIREPINFRIGEYYHIFTIDKSDTSFNDIEVVENIQLQGMTFLAIFAEVASTILIIVFLALLIKETISKLLNTEQEEEYDY